MALSEEQIKVFGQTLTDKGATQPCSRCGHKQFSVIDETFVKMHPLRDDSATEVTLVPAVLIMCKNCGNLWHHALAPIGLLPANLKGKAS